jgi:hypothetical protein
METVKNNQLYHPVNSKNPLLSIGLVMVLLTLETEIANGLMNSLSFTATRHFDYFFLISPHFLYTFTPFPVHLLCTSSQPSVHILLTFCALPPNFLYTSYTKPIHFVYLLYTLSIPFVYLLYRPRIYQRYTMDTPRIPLGYPSNSYLSKFHP